MNSRPSEKLRLARTHSGTPQEESRDSPDLDMAPNEADRPPLPLRSLLTKPVVVTIANQAMLSLINAVAMSYIPLVWSTPVEYGGLSMSPASIGVGLSVYGSIGGVFQVSLFSHFVSHFGLRRVFLSAIIAGAVIYVVFPFENLAMVAGGGQNLIVWLLIILQMFSLCVFDMGYSKSTSHTPSSYPVRILMMHVGSLRCHERVRLIRRSQQTVSRRSVWPFACDELDSGRRWACCRRLVICVLPDA
jgi:hypothetical protein